jgi:hypothetical protein
MAGPYFEGDHPELKSLLENHFTRVRDAFIAQGWRGCLVLGGGYGRGEGGVMQGRNGLCFSNDLDYFLFDQAPGNPRLESWCRQIEREESRLMGIDVEIKCLRPDSLGDPSVSMMFADLVAGHVQVAGDASFLRSLRPNLDFSRLDPTETTRLLWNRGSGLFFSCCRMDQDAQMSFVIRNHAKAKLAMGDAWLCLNGQYTSMCRERAARLALLDVPSEFPHLRQWHADGVAFKFSPVAEGRTWQELHQESRQLIEAWGALYLVVEQNRLQRTIAGFSEYLAMPRLVHGPSRCRNLAIALRDRLKRGAFLRPLGDYPRAGLMRALPCLLGLTPGGLAQAARFLPTPAGDLALAGTWESLYEKWWSYYA